MSWQHFAAPPDAADIAVGFKLPTRAVQMSNVKARLFSLPKESFHTHDTMARALGLTPQQVSSGLAAAQVLPALVGAVLGIPAALGLIAAVSTGATTLRPRPRLGRPENSRWPGLRVSTRQRSPLPSMAMP